MSDIPNNNQVQQQLTQYHQIAQELRASKNQDEVKTVLAPLTSLTEDNQIAFLKALSQEKHVDAADINLAINTVSPAKLVRKEARRSLIRLESSKIYPEWQLPTPTTPGQALDLPSSDALLSELQSLMSDAAKFLAGPAYGNVVDDFIENWSDGNYGEAYDLLASNSPLRGGLTRGEWVERRLQWKEQAHPTNEEVSFIYDRAENAEDEQENQAQQSTIEVGWSLEFTDVPFASMISELPVASAVFKETGRHWFWTSYTLTQEEDEWLIDTMSDETVNARHQSSAELQQHIADIVAIAEQQLAEEEDEDEIEDEDIIDAEASSEEDEFDDEEDEDDEIEDEEAFEDTLSRMEEAIRLTTQAMHYNDALIAHDPQADPAVYQQAFAQAMSVNEPERAAVYLQQLAERFPALRGEALRELAFTLDMLIDTYTEDDEEERAEHFRSLAENTLREAIAVEPSSAAAYIMLADLLIESEDQLDEALKLLQQAQPLTSNTQEITLIEAGLAEIAQIHEQPEESLKHYLKVAELAPDSSRSLVPHRLALPSHAPAQ